MGYLEVDVGDHRLFHSTQRSGGTSTLDPGQPHALASKSPRVVTHPLSQAFHAENLGVGWRCRVPKEFELQVFAITSGRHACPREYEVERPGCRKGDGRGLAFSQGRYRSRYRGRRWLREDHRALLSSPSPTFGRVGPRHRFPSVRRGARCCQETGATFTSFSILYNTS